LRISNASSWKLGKANGGAMLGRKIAAVAAFTLIASASYSQKHPAPMKGYELFSWKENGHWHYSLLPGTNREKTYEEITSKATVIVGTSNFEAELKRLPKGAECYGNQTRQLGSRGPHRVKRLASSSRRENVSTEYEHSVTRWA
jgi:hypothetical protein